MNTNQRGNTSMKRNIKIAVLVATVAVASHGVTASAGTEALVEDTATSLKALEIQNAKLRKQVARLDHRAQARQRTISRLRDKVAKLQAQRDNCEAQA